MCFGQKMFIKEMNNRKIANTHHYKLKYFEFTSIYAT